MQNSTLQSLQLHPLSPAHGLSVEAITHRLRSQVSRKEEISWQAIYYHWQKWSADGSFERVWQHSILTIHPDLDLSQLNLDGSHAMAKNGGGSVAYQPRKQAKISNILPITDAK